MAKPQFGRIAVRRSTDGLVVGTAAADTSKDILFGVSCNIKLDNFLDNVYSLTRATS